MKNLWGREPALVIAAFGGVLALFIPDEAAVKAIVAAGSLLLGALTRSQVSPARPPASPD